MIYRVTDMRRGETHTIRQAAYAQDVLWRIVFWPLWVKARKRA